MGAEPWDCYTEFDPDLNALLQRTRTREFEAGNYSGDSVEGMGNGARHASIEEAMEDADADGTASILDIETVRLDPDDEGEPGVACPLSKDKLIELFGSERPSQSDVEECDDLYDLIGRGCCFYIFVYDDDKSDTPSGICWRGYSYD